MEATLAFQRLVAAVDPASLVETAAAAKEGDEDAQTQVVAAMVWAAFSCPDGVCPLYDTLAALWLAWGDVEECVEDLPRAPLDEAFWQRFWSAIDQGRRESYTPATATARIARVSRSTDPEFLALAERVAVARFGRDGGFGAAPDPDIDPGVWASCPADSLGAALHDKIARNSYDPQIGTKRELRTLPPTLQRLHTHADRLDGVWRALAGYSSTDSHLIAFAAFQLAQLGHLFSASALAVFAALAHFVIPKSFHILIHLIAEGWRHGRQAPPLLTMTWPSHWDEPIDAVRKRFEIPTYDSVFSSKLFYTLPRYASAPDH